MTRNLNFEWLKNELRKKPSLLDEPPFCDCNRELLVHAVCGYVVSTMSREKRSALRRYGISEKVLKSNAKKTLELSEFLTRLFTGKEPGSERFWPVLYLPIEQVLPRDYLKRYLQWTATLAHIARTIDNAVPCRIDTNDAALAISLHRCAC